MIDAPPGWDPVVAFTRGDQERSTRLRANLRRIATEAPDPHVRRLAGAVLDGRKTVRELVRDPTMERELTGAMHEFAEQWARLSPQERARLVEQGRVAIHPRNEHRR